MRSNCVVEAVRLFRERIAEWRKDPKARQEPYLLVRPSRVDGGVCHTLVGELDPDTDQVRVVSFKPDESVERPWWRPPVVFSGHWEEGDTKPAPLDESRS